MANALDPYSPCPCGTGKKIKFCCPDLIHELSEIQSMLEGGQRQACLDYIEWLEKKHPEQGLPRHDQGAARIGARQRRQGRRDARRFLGEGPDEPGGARRTGGRLRRAARRDRRHRTAATRAGTEPEIALRPRRHVGRPARRNAADGRPGRSRPAATSCWPTSCIPQDEATLQLLARFFAAPTIPLLLKNEQTFETAPAGVPWQAEFDAAVDDARRGRWWRAADKLKKLAADGAGNAPDRLEEPGRSCVRGWPTCPARSRRLRKFSTLDVPYDDAVEAEALAQLIDPAAPTTSSTS